MRIDIRDLQQQVGEHRTARFSEPVGTLSLGGDEVRFEEPAQVTAELFNTGKGILADVQVEAEAELHCSRCLKPFQMPLSLHFREEFRPEGAELQAGAHESARPAGKHRRGHQPEPESEEEEESGEVYSTYTGDFIDLSQSVEENVFLGIPMKPLCRPDCQGLCPQCGHDLNEGPCGCEEPTADPRLAGLKELWAKRDGKH